MYLKYNVTGVVATYKSLVLDSKIHTYVLTCFQPSCFWLPTCNDVNAPGCETITAYCIYYTIT